MKPEEELMQLHQPCRVLRWSKNAFCNMTHDQIRCLAQETGKEMVATRLQIIQTLRQMVNEVEAIHRDVHIAKAAGASVSIIGGGLSVGGFIASFFTFGAAGVVAIVGAAIAGSGGVTTFGASIGDIVQNKRYKKKQMQLFQKDKLLVDQLLELISLLPENNNPGIKETSENETCNIENVLSSVKGTAIVGKSVADVAKTAVTLATEVGDDVAATIFRASGQVTRGLHIAGGVFSIIVLPLDIYTLVTSAKSLAKKEGPALAQALKALADDLEDNLFEIENKLRVHGI